MFNPSQTMFRFILALLSLAVFSPPDVTADEMSADVVVYGSTPGGFCAAIAAAREGVSVILLEPTEHVGGLSTGGLSHCDSNQMVRETLMGLFDEWHRRVVKDYTDRGLPAPYDATRKDQSLWTFEPHVAMRVTKQMLDEAGVKVLTGRWLQSITKTGPRLTSLITDNGTFTAKVFVDGSYEGDLMAAAGVEWTIGREGRAEFGESYAGKRYPKNKMEISGFDDDGKLLPLLTTDEAGPEDAGDKNIMTYSFRLCLTSDSKNRIPIPAPANYDPARFEVVRRFLKAGGSPSQVGFDLYPLPGGKLDGNNSIGKQFSIGLVGACNDWHSADKAARQDIWEAHKQYTLEFYQFLTTDPEVPPAMRKQYAEIGLCQDEFAATNHFSPALYVRESRRMKGMHVITQRDILDEPAKDDPIAISSFPIDSHDCQRVALKGGGVVNEGTIFPVRKAQPKQGYAYHVPYRAVLPVPAQCDNLVVPIALSCSHVGISSLRIEGAWMVIGQGAGIAAALAAKESVAVQELPYPKLRERLQAQGQVLDLPVAVSKTVPSLDAFIPVKSLPEIVLDDAEAELVGDWARSTNFMPCIGSGYRVHGDKNAHGDGKASATFRVKVPKSGRYKLRMAYSAHETRATNVPVTITSGGNETKFTVDQTKPMAKGEYFQLIGTADFLSEAEAIIQITNTDTVGFVILDAIQLLPVEVDAVKAESSQVTVKPNVLLVLADDLGVECLSTYGGNSHKTPNIDRLAKDGMHFTRCFSNPFCSPSRGQLLTGCYPFKNGLKVVLHSKSQENIFLRPSQPSFARQLKQHGYATQIVGKWHVSLEHKHNTIQEFGFDHYQTWSIFDDKGQKTTRFWNPYQMRDGRIIADENKDRYGPDVDLDVYLDFIKSSAKANRPFLAFYSTYLPHYPWEPTPDSKGLSKDHAYRAPNVTHKGDPKYFPDMVAYLDKQIGLMLQTLDDLGIADNTIVLFLADNGTDRDLNNTWGDDRKPITGGKGTMTDRGTHVPLIVSWPGRIKAGSTCEDLVDLSDFLPTLCELTGASLPKEKIHGRSFAPQLFGEPGNPREWIHIQNADDRQVRNNDYMLDNKNKLRRVLPLWEDSAKPNENKHPETEAAARKALQAVFTALQE